MDTERKFLASIAQIVHQAYHTSPTFPKGDFITWESCPKDVCSSIKRRLDDLKERDSYKRSRR